MDNNKNIKQTCQYDVMVIGGGIAGVSAAISARRQGMKVLLIEKSVMLGGLATLGNIAIYLPLCDGNRHQVAAGLSEELLYESIRYGYSNLDPYWNKQNKEKASAPNARYQTHFSPAEFVIALDEIIVREGVDLLFDAVLSEPVMEGSQCKGVVVETKLGRKYYEAAAFIDATGDGDLFVRAGADFIYEKNWLAYWAYSVSFESIKDAMDKQDIMKAVKLEIQGGMHSGVNPKERIYSLDDTTRFILDGRQLLKKNALTGDRNKKTLMNLPGMPQFRTTCRLVGIYTLTETDLNKQFEDSIGVIGDWRNAGKVVEIPYRALISPKLDNVFVAGRCISSDGDVWEITRVIPAVAVTGEAAGIAAAEVVRSNKNVHHIKVRNVQNAIENADGIIHF